MDDVSIILPTKNNEDCIDELLDSLFSQNLEGNLEIIMLDSSDDDTPVIAKKYDLKIVRVEPEDYNYGETRNFGASISSGKYLVFISTDVEIRDRNWLKKLLLNFSDPIVAGVYGRQLPKKGASIMEEFFIKYTYPNVRKDYFVEDSNDINDFFFSNTNSAIRRKVWEEISFPVMLMSEDQEWAKRALLNGHKIIYEPDAVVYHSHNYSLKRVFKRYFDSGATLPYVYYSSVIKNNFIKKGIKYELSLMKYIINKRDFLKIPYCFLYEFIKFLGYIIGTKYRYIPNSIRKKISYNESYWLKYNDIIILS